MAWEAVEVEPGAWAVLQRSPAGIPIVAAAGTPDHTTFDEPTAKRLAEERNADAD